MVLLLLRGATNGTIPLMKSQTFSYCVLTLGIFLYSQTVGDAVTDSTQNGTGTLKILPTPLNSAAPFPPTQPVAAAQSVVLATIQEPPRLLISELGENVDLKVTGGPGVHQLQSKGSLSEPNWSALGGLTTDTNIVHAKNAGNEFIRAAAAPDHDISIVENSRTM